MIVPPKTFQKLDPLPDNHPAIGAPCPICTQPFKQDDVTTLFPNSTGQFILIHWDCLNLFDAIEI